MVKSVGHFYSSYITEVRVHMTTYANAHARAAADIAYMQQGRNWHGEPTEQMHGNRLAMHLVLLSARGW